MQGFDPRPLGAVIGSAAVVWFIMRQCGREARHYAIAGAGAAMILGMDYAYGLPLYAYLAIIFLAPFLYHRGVRTRLKALISKMEPIDLSELSIRLVRCPEGASNYLAMWRAEHIDKTAEEQQLESSIIAAPSIVAETAAGALPESLLIALEFEGEMDDDYDVILTGDAPKGLSGQLMLCHREAVGAFTHVHEEHQEVGSVNGAEAWMCIRSNPPGYAYQLLDAPALEMLHELFALQNDSRQMYTVVEGDKIRIVSTRTFNAEELRTFITWGARWVQKVRTVG